MPKKNLHLFALAISTGLFILYALTASRTVTLEDSGEFIMTSFYWGVAHPPGYPLYTALGHLISQIPLGSPAYRLHLLSALLGALTCGVLFLCAHTLLRNRFFSFVAALAFGLSLTFWSQAIVAEVYSLNTLFFFTLFYLSLRLSQDFQKNIFLIFCLIFGLSLSNHWPLIVLSLPILIITLWPVRGMVLRSLGLGLVFIGLGLSPYWLMIWRSHLGTEMIFSGPIRTLREFFAFVTRKEYMSLEDSPTASLADSALFFFQFLIQSAREFAFIGAPIILFGLYSLKSSSRGLKLVFAFAILSSSLFLKFFEVNDFEPLNLQAYLVYHLIPYGFMALALGFGLLAIDQHSHKVARIVGGLVLVAMVIFGFRQNNSRQETLAMDYAKATLSALPSGAHLFMHSESDTGPIGYAHYVEKIRGDVKVYSQLGLLFKNRIFDPVNDSVKTKVAKSKRFFLEHQPVFLSSPLYFVEDKDLPPLSISKFGILSVVTQQGYSGAEEEQIETAKRILDEAILRPYRGVWTFHAGFVYSHFCSLLARHQIEHSFKNQNPFCKMQYALESFRAQRFADAHELFKSLAEGPQFLTPLEHAKLASVYAQNEVNLINSKNPTPDQRLSSYQLVADRLVQVINAYPSCKNPAIETLNTLIHQGGVKAFPKRCQATFAGHGALTSP